MGIRSCAKGISLSREIPNIFLHTFSSVLLIIVFMDTKLFTLIIIVSNTQGYSLQLFLCGARNEVNYTKIKVKNMLP